MSDLLDLVPDSVFICTKTRTSEEDKSESSGLFANFKMNQFFGCNVLKSQQKAIEDERVKKEKGR